MSCFSPNHNKSSPSKKLWKGLLSILQKKMNPLRRSKSCNSSSRYPLNRDSVTATVSYHHHHYLPYYHHHYPYNVDSENIEKRVAKAVFAPCDTYLQGHNNQLEEIKSHDDDDFEDLEGEDQGKMVNCDHVELSESSGSMALELHGVDASAEEFIEKMKGYWKLERQKSLENYIEILTRFYEH